MITREKQFEFLDRITANYLEKHGPFCQKADREDLKQEVLIRLAKIIPEAFDSERHFFNWGRKFTRLYSINAIRDQFTKWRNRSGEMLLADVDEDLSDHLSCLNFWQEKELEERMFRFKKWNKFSSVEEQNIAKVLVSAKIPSKDVANELRISPRQALNKLDKYGFRKKRLTF